MKQIFALLSFIFIAFYGFSQSDFNFELQKLLQQPQYRNAAIGIHVVDLANGSTLIEMNGDKLLIPASALKIITSATALEILGPDYCFKTHVGYTGKIADNNELNGDLVIIGGGDPTLGSVYFRNSALNDSFIQVWVNKIKASGVKKITGNIIMDGSAYDNEEIPPTWVWGDIGNYYGAGANAFTCFDNRFSITFRSPANAGEQTEIISVYPKTEGLKIENEVVASDINRDLAYVYGSPLSKNRVIRGTIPKNKNSFTIKASLFQPGELMAAELVRQLAAEGIFFSGKVEFEKINKSEVNTIYIYESPPLAEIVKVLNHESVNLFAEHLIKQIAFAKTGQGSREKGIELVKKFWQSHDIDTQNLFMEDGSGLSHFNAISPAQLTSVLTYMAQKSVNRDVFLNSLPIAGEGTLSGFDSGIFPGKTLRAKSGSMTRVRCYTGYLLTDSGKTIVFSFMFNHFSGTNSKLSKEIENFLCVLKKTIF